MDPKNPHIFAAAILTVLLTGRAGAEPEMKPPETKMIALSTGSELATWTITSDKATHKTPILFLHGGPGMFTTPSNFDKGAPLRAAGFTTVYFDQAGGGKSKRIPAREYTLDRAVADVEALRLTLGANRVILWGSSYGASLAALYATRFPSQVAGLIFTSPGGFPGTSVKHDYSLTNRGKVDLGKALSQAASRIDKQGGAAEAKLTQDEAGKLFDAVVSGQLLDGTTCKGTDAPPSAISSGGNLYPNRMLQKELKSIKRPTGPAVIRPVVIIRGSCDFIPVSAAEDYRKSFGGTIVPILNSGHGLREQPAALRAALDHFAMVDLASVE
jgi:pimeloyl-ACP methyl ester carboxylesterase